MFVKNKKKFKHSVKFCKYDVFSFKLQFNSFKNLYRVYFVLIINTNTANHYVLWFFNSLPFSK